MGSMLDDRRYPPRRKPPGPPEGQDFDTLTRLHGRPIGAFEKAPPKPRDRSLARAIAEHGDDALHTAEQLRTQASEAAE